VVSSVDFAGSDEQFEFVAGAIDRAPGGGSQAPPGGRARRLRSPSRQRARGLCRGRRKCRM